MDEKDPNQESRLDPRAVPVAVASVVVILLGIFLTYANTTFGALIVLIGLCGIVWVGSLAVKRDT
jgi:hypothetical protein